MSVAEAPPDSPEKEAARWKCVQYTSISEIGEAWDALVPRERPHFRAGMFAAIERSGMLQSPTYFVLYDDQDPVAAAFVFTHPTDTVAMAPAPIKRLVARVRQRAPGFLWKEMRVCGSPISNSSCGVCFASHLDQEGRRRAMRQLAGEILRDAGMDKSLFFREFTEEEVEDYAWELERLGFFSVDPWPGTVMELRWDTFDDYLAALRKRYRKRVRTDMKASSELEFELLDTFADLAPAAYPLYRNVQARADYNLETLNEEFFAGMSDFEQAKLLVAREPKAGAVLGVNLLLFGETHMQNLFIGFDYEQNEKHNIYFSLVEHSLRLAIEHGCGQVYLGQDSYEFKARLGAKPVPMTAYMKHRVWPIHWLLRASAGSMFPPCEPVTHDVFQEEASNGKGKKSSGDGEPRE